MTILKVTPTKITFDWILLHSLSTEELIELRERIMTVKHLRDSVRKLDCIKLEFSDMDIKTIYMNDGLEHELKSHINHLILDRNLAKGRKRIQ